MSTTSIASKKYFLLYLDFFGNMNLKTTLKIHILNTMNLALEKAKIKGRGASNVKKITVVVFSHFDYDVCRLRERNRRN